MNEDRCIVGIDLGGTRFRVALADQNGKILFRKSWLTNSVDGKDSVLSRILEAVRETLDEHGGNRSPIGIGIGVPGPVDPWSGVVYSPPNLPGWGEVPVKTFMEMQLNLPVYVGNDANLAALGEFTFGAGVGVKDMVYITVSTGIGGGIVAGGKLLLGVRGLAGEIGHMTIDKNGPTCPCGNTGCLEVLASGTAIARIARQRLITEDNTILASLFAQAPENITAEAVVAAARQKDAMALQILGKAAEYLGIGVVNVVHIFNPSLVVIGGGVSNAGPLIFEPVIRMVKERVMPRLQEGLAIVPSTLGDDAGLLGAIALVTSSINPG